MMWMPSWKARGGRFSERIVAESGLRQERGAFCLDAMPDQVPEALFRLGQALTRIYDLTFLSRSNVGSTFYRAGRRAA